MKDIYKLLNGVEIDENEFEEMDVSDIEIARVKNRLKSSIKIKKNWKKRAIAVAALVVISTTTFGVVFPAYASNIPIVGDIFRALDNGRTGLYDNYKENANELNVTKKSKGINITINDAIFDGRTITLTYTIESNKDLGEEFYLDNNFVIQEAKRSGSTSGAKFVRVHGNTYVGQENITIFDFVDNPKESINLEMKISGITMFGERNKDVNINGNWDFNISLDAIGGNKEIVNQSVEKYGITATVDEVDITPMSIFITYSQKVSEEALNKWDNIDLEIEVKDDLGNVYIGRGNGGTGDINNNTTWSSTFGKLKEGATKLIVTPKVVVRRFSEPRNIEVEVSDGGKESVSTNTPTWDCVERKELILDDIVIELKK